MKNLFEVAFEIQNFCLDNKWQFCFIGGLALQRWGENRVTQDVDLTILTGIQNEEKFAEKLLSKYKARINNPVQFALQHRVVLLKNENNIGIDISLAALPFEEKMISRASFHEFYNDISLFTCSAEDLIVMKIFAERIKDLIDAESIIIRQGDKLDIKYIKEELAGLAELKEEPELLDILDKMLRENL